MSLPTKAIDRLFERLAATYGAAWDRSLGATPVCDVKTVWAHELAGYGDRLADVAWALENLPERCPNVIEFRNLCRRAPAPEVPRLPEPKADPERVRAEFAKLADLRDSMAATAKSGVRNVEWAHRILARRDAGEKISPTVLAMAKGALRLDLPAASEFV